jgi:hypothetical protein
MLTSVSVIIIIPVQKIVKKEDLQDNKHNKKFDDDYQP